MVALAVAGSGGWWGRWWGWRQWWRAGAAVAGGGGRSGGVVVGRAWRTYVAHGIPSGLGPKSPGASWSQRVALQEGRIFCHRAYGPKWQGSGEWQTICTLHELICQPDFRVAYHLLDSSTERLFPFHLPFAFRFDSPLLPAATSPNSPEQFWLQILCELPPLLWHCLRAVCCV